MIRVSLLIAVLWGSACGTQRYCSVLVECTCNCTNGSANQITGRACVAEPHEGDCAEWAAPKRESTQAACLDKCMRFHGDSTATCQLAPLPGNPVVTVNNGVCPVGTR